MPNEIILSGFTFEQFQDTIKGIVRNEVTEALSGLPVAPEPSPEFITRREAAETLRISLPTLNEWTKTGIIPASRIGTRIRYAKADVLNSLKEVETLKYRRAAK
jgi:excisionase family DNA binding protein